METYNGQISDNSLWITTTPTPITLNLPFYATEAGCFHTKKGYFVERDFHDSFLFIYTLTGKGCIKTDTLNTELLPHHAIVIDCHNNHSYFCNSDTWDFIWIHLKGDSIASVFNVLYPETVSPVKINGHKEFEDFQIKLIDGLSKNDIINNISLSLNIHHLINSLIKFKLQTEEDSRKSHPSYEVNTVINFIENNYASPISIDDMIQDIHISKYHFIRIFKRIIGITPYNYLTNYRINISKTLLISTDKTISEISEECGFSDTSNFISQFKKHTGQRPFEYRKDFS